jgi:hypothetical protein
LPLLQLLPQCHLRAALRLQHVRLGRPSE